MQSAYAKMKQALSAVHAEECSVCSEPGTLQMESYFGGSYPPLRRKDWTCFVLPEDRWFCEPCAQVIQAGAQLPAWRVWDGRHLGRPLQEADLRDLNVMLYRHP